MPELIPVIHILGKVQVRNNVEICREAGIKKIFLISHQFNSPDTLKTAIDVKERYHDLWVGVNLLHLTTEECLVQDLPLDGLWCDNGLTDKSRDELQKIRESRRFKGMFFGGLEFKYQKQSNDLEEACDKADEFHDVCTTSGSGTGYAPTTKKIETLREHLGPYKKLAIASGISESNIDWFKRFIDYALVASSITDPLTEIISREKLIVLNNRIS